MSIPYEAHPRSRGEHVPLIEPPVRVSGSSPLARGTLHSNLHRHFGVRLIPARAGNTLQLGHASEAQTAHPRSRGEHPAAWSCVGGADGSSPLARGTHAPHTAPDPAARLIPARAGNTGDGGVNQRVFPAHPRSRGEHVPVWVSPGLVNGSSPLARGTHRPEGLRRRNTRLIPARAGNTAG